MIQILNVKIYSKIPYKLSKYVKYFVKEVRFTYGKECKLYQLFNECDGMEDFEKSVLKRAYIDTDLAEYYTKRGLVLKSVVSPDFDELSRVKPINGILSGVQGVVAREFYEGDNCFDSVDIMLPDFTCDMIRSIASDNYSIDIVVSKKVCNSLQKETGLNVEDLEQLIGDIQVTANAEDFYQTVEELEASTCHCDIDDILESPELRCSGIALPLELYHNKMMKVKSIIKSES